MNHQPVTAIVKSIEGVEFAVATDAAAVPYELEFAATKPAAYLELHDDYVRVDSARAMTEAPRPQDDIGYIAKLTAVGGHEPEALVRARHRWGVAGFVQDAPEYSDGDEPEELQ